MPLVGHEHAPTRRVGAILDAPNATTLLAWAGSLGLDPPTDEGCLKDLEQGRAGGVSGLEIFRDWASQKWLKFNHPNNDTVMHREVAFLREQLRVACPKIMGRVAEANAGE